MGFPALERWNVYLESASLVTAIARLASAYTNVYKYQLDYWYVICRVCDRVACVKSWWGVCLEAEYNEGFYSELGIQTNPSWGQNIS